MKWKPPKYIQKLKNPLTPVSAGRDCPEGIVNVSLALAGGGILSRMWVFGCFWYVFQKGQKFASTGGFGARGPFFL